MLKYVNYFIIFLTSFVLDRITKYWIVTGIVKPQVVCEYFNIYVTFNRGIAWGVGSNWCHWSSFALYSFIAFLLLYFIYFLKTILHDTMLSLGCVLTLAGGISNFIDRFWYTGVVDFIQLHIGEYYFPVFNVADISITIGAFLLLYGLFKQQD